MKSWKNRRNTYWILVATVFGLMFPSNQTNYYKNFIGLILCWGLYWFCFFCNNREVEEQEQREREEHQKCIELERIKKEKERIKKEKENQWFCESVEYPKIINYIMIKYNRDWEKDLYPQNARWHLNDIKRKINSDIEFQKREIRSCKNTIIRLENLKNKIKSKSKQEEYNETIKKYQLIISNCQKNIEDIPEKNSFWISFYQNDIERYKDKCREFEQKANDLLQNSPEKIIKAVDCHLKKIEEVKQRPLKSYYDDRDIWVKREEEKIPYLLQAKSDAVNIIKEKEK